FIINFSNCSYQEKQIYINPELINKSQVLLSEYIDCIQYIPLSFEVPIRSIRAIDIYDNLIFIGAGLEGMLIFNEDGSFNKKISSTGKGPGEYYSVNSFAIDYENKLIFILNAGRAAKIMAYSFNGDLIYEFSNLELHGVFQKIA